MIQLATATDREEIRSCYALMLQLRPHLASEQAFVEQVQRQIEQGYHLAYIKTDGQVRALAGFRFLEFLAWKKVLYVDDLISDVVTRKQGYGSAILRWVIEQAKTAQCNQVHLDSGPQRHDAHRLYLNHGFNIIGYHFALEVSSG